MTRCRRGRGRSPFQVGGPAGLRAEGIHIVYWELLFLECLVRRQTAVLDEGEAISGDWREDLEMFSATEIILAALQRRDWKKTK